MKFITVRDLATKNKKTRKIISREDSVLTLNGKPIAYMIPVDENNFEFVVNEAVRIRAKAAFESMQKTAGAAGLTEKDGLKEMAEYKKGKKERRNREK